MEETAIAVFDFSFWWTSLWTRAWDLNINIGRFILVHDDGLTCLKFDYWFDGYGYLCRYCGMMRCDVTCSRYLYLVLSNSDYWLLITDYWLYDLGMYDSAVSCFAYHPAICCFWIWIDTHTTHAILVLFYFLEGKAILLEGQWYRFWSHFTD